MTDAFNKKFSETLCSSTLGLGTAFKIDKLKMHPNFVAVEEADPIKAAGVEGIHLPQNMDRDQRLGRVVVKPVNGPYEVGDLILFQKQSGDPVEIAGRHLRFLENADLSGEILGWWPSGTWPEDRLFDNGEAK